MAGRRHSTVACDRLSSSHFEYTPEYHVEREALRVYSRLDELGNLLQASGIDMILSCAFLPISFSWVTTPMFHELMSLLDNLLIVSARKFLTAG